LAAVPVSQITISIQTRNRSRVNLVGIATACGVDDRGVGVRFPVGSRIFSSPRRPDRLWCPRSLLSSGYRGLFPRGLKRPWREADHSPPTSAELKKNVDLHIHSTIRFHDVVLNLLSTGTTLSFFCLYSDTKHRNEGTVVLACTVTSPMQCNASKCSAHRGWAALSSNPEQSRSWPACQLLFAVCSSFEFQNI
jgi:hypothetical protein